VYIDPGHAWLISIGDDSVLIAGTIVLAHAVSTRLQTGAPESPA
jgi:hypothetical protein